MLIILGYTHRILPLKNRTLFLDGLCDELHKYSQLQTSIRYQECLDQLMPVTDQRSGQITTQYCKIITIKSHTSNIL